MTTSRRRSPLPALPDRRQPPRQATILSLCFSFSLTGCCSPSRADRSAGSKLAASSSPSRQIVGLEPASVRFATRVSPRYYYIFYIFYVCDDDLSAKYDHITGGADFTKRSPGSDVVKFTFVDICFTRFRKLRFNHCSRNALSSYILFLLVEHRNWLQNDRRCSCCRLRRRRFSDNFSRVIVFSSFFCKSSIHVVIERIRVRLICAKFSPVHTSQFFSLLVRAYVEVLVIRGT